MFQGGVGRKTGRVLDHYSKTDFILPRPLGFDSFPGTGTNHFGKDIRFNRWFFETQSVLSSSYVCTERIIEQNTQTDKTQYGS